MPFNLLIVNNHARATRMLALVIISLLAVLVFVPTALATSVTVTGNVYSNETGAVWAPCDGVTNNIRVDGDQVPCDDTTGAYSGTATVASAYETLAVWIDNDTANAVTYTLNLTNTVHTISNLHVYKDRTTIDLRDSTAITNGTGNGGIGIRDYSFDTVDFDLDADGTNLTNPGAPTKLWIKNGEYAPGGNVNVESIELSAGGTYTAGGTTTLTAGGTGTTCTAAIGTVMPLCGTGTTVFGSNSTVFNSTSATKVKADTYGPLTLNPAGAPTYTVSGAVTATTLLIGDAVNAVVVDNTSGAITATTSLTVYANATLSGTNNVTVNGAVNGGGTITMTGGVFKQRVAANAGFGTTAGTNDWTFATLKFENSSAAARTITTSTVGSGDIIVNTSLIVGLATDTDETLLNADTNDRAFAINGTLFVLTANSGNNHSILTSSSSKSTTVTGDTTIDGTWQGSGSVTVNGSVTGVGMLNFTGGAFTQRVAVNESFGSTGSADDWSFNTLNFENSSGTAARTITTSTGGSGEIAVNAALHIGKSTGADTFQTTLDANTNDRTLSVYGTLSIHTANAGTRLSVLTSSSANATTVVGNATVNGTWQGSGNVTASGSITGSGTVNFSGGIFKQRVAASAAFGATSGSNNWTFATLNFENSSGAAASTITTSAGGSGSIIINTALAIGLSTDTYHTLLDANTNDRTLTDNGSLTISTANFGTRLSVLTDSSANAMTVSGNSTVNGTWQGTGNVTVNGSVSGSGTINLTGGSFTQRVSVDQTFGSTSGANNWTFAALNFENSSVTAARIVTISNGGSGNITVSGGIHVGESAGADTYQTTLDADTYDRTIVDNGILQIHTANGGTLLSVLTSSSANTMTVGGDATINGTWQGSGNVTAKGSVSGGGTLTFSGGTFDQRVAATKNFGTNVANANNWTFNHLTFSNSHASLPFTISTNGTGTGSIIVNGDLNVGKTGDAAGAVTTLNANTSSRIIDANANVVVTSKGTLQAPASGTSFTIAGSFTNNGTFAAGTGTVEFDTASTAALTYSAPTSFNNLTTTVAGKTLTFDNVNQTTVAGTLTATGASCTNKVNLYSDSVGNQYEIAIGTSAITFANIKDSAVTTAKSATNSFSESNNNVNWTISGCITVAGNAYTNESSTPWIPANGGQCDGVTSNISLSIAGAAKISTSCNGATGAWSFTGVVPASASDNVVAVFLDASNADRASLHTLTADASTNITGLQLSKGRSRLRSESATSISNASIATFDNTGDAKILLESSAGPLAETAATKLVVEAGETYTPGNNVTVSALEIESSATYTSDTFTTTLTSSGTNATCTGDISTVIPLCSPGTYTYSASTTTFTGTGAVHVAALTSYYNLKLQPTSGAPTYQLGTANGQSLAIGNLTVGNGTDAVTVDTSTYSPTVTVNSASTVNVAGTLGGSGTGTFMVKAGVNGAGTINFTGGTFEHRFGAARFFGTPSGSNDWTFNNLTFSSTVASTSTLQTGGTGAIIVDGNLTVGKTTDATIVTLQADTNDRNIDVNGNLVINDNGSGAPRGVLEASDSAALTIAGNFTNNGTFNANSGTVTFDTTATSTLTYSAPSTFNNLTTTTVGKTLSFDNVDQTTVSGTMTVTGSSCADKIYLESNSAGNQFEIAIGTAAITYASIKDSAVTTAKTAAGSNNNGNNNANWTISGCITVSGNAYTNEASTPWIPANGGACDGVTPNISLSFDGGTKQSTSCNGATGAWSFTGNVPIATADKAIIVFMDTEGGDKGALITRNVDKTSAITGLTITEEYYRIRHETTTPISTYSIDNFDYDQDNDVPLQVTSGVLTQQASTEVLVESGKAFAPTKNVTISSLDLHGVYAAGPFVATTLTSSGTGTCASGPGTQRPLCITGGVLSAGTFGTVTFSGTSTVNVQGAAYPNLALAPSGGSTPTYNLGAGSATTRVQGALTIGNATNGVAVSTTSNNAVTDVVGDLIVNASATFSGSGSGATTVGGSTTGAGTISLTAGTYNARANTQTQSFGTTSGSNNWNFNTLNIDNGVVFGTAGQSTYTSGGTDYAEAIAKDSQGNVYMAGGHAVNVYDWYVRKYTPTGALDTSFGSSGMVTWDSGGAGWDVARGMVVDANDNIYVAGSAGVNSGDWTVRKYNSSGVLCDGNGACPNWGSSGMVAWDSGVNDEAYAIAIDGAANIFVTGYHGGDWATRKYGPNGSLCDGSNNPTGTGICTPWATSGMVSIAAGSLATSITLDPFGNVYVAGAVGSNGEDWEIRKFGPNGSQCDGSDNPTGTGTCAVWGSSGRLTWNSTGAAYDRAYSIATDASGNIFVAGVANTQEVVRKYGPNGSFCDGSDNPTGTGTCTVWGSSGSVSYTNGGSGSGQSIIVDGTGGIYVGGHDAFWTWGVRKYGANGSLCDGSDNPTGTGTCTAWGTSSSGMVESGQSYSIGEIVVDAAANLIIDGSSDTDKLRKYTPTGVLATGDATVTTNGSGSGSIAVSALTVGNASDADTTTINNETNDRILDTNGAFAITSEGVYLASSTAAFTVAGNFTNNGTFTANSGTVAFDTAGTSTLTYSAPSTFNNLTTTTVGKTLKFDNVDQTTVSGTMTVTGSSCTGKIYLESDSAGNQFEIAIGTAAITYASIKDSAVTTAKSATGSHNNGNNNGNWTIAGCITVSGTAFDNETGTIWAGCALNYNISLSINAAAKQTTTCNGSGDWSFTGMVNASAADQLLVAYFDPSAGTDRAATYTRNNDTSTNITGLSLTKGRTRIRSESATNITNAAIGSFDNSNDGKIPVEASAGPLTQPTATKMIVEAGETYAPGDSVTVQALEVLGTYTGSGTLTLTGIGTNTTCTSDAGTVMPLCSSGTFTAPPTMTFKGIGALYVPPLVFNTLNLQPSGAGSPTYQLGSDTSQTITASSLTVGDGTNPVTVDMNTFQPTVDVGTGAGTGAVAVSSGATLQYTAGSAGSTISSTGTWSGAGTINMIKGVVEQHISQNESFGPTGANTWTLNNVKFYDEAAATPYTTTLTKGSSGGIIFDNNVTVGYSGGPHDVLTVDAETNDPLIAANANFTVAAKGVYQASSSSALTISGNFVNNNTFTANNGTVTFADSAQTSNLTYAAATTFYNLTAATAGKTLKFDHLSQTNVTNALTVAGSACGSANSVRLHSDLAGSQYALNAPGTNSINYAQIEDANAVAALNATGSFDEGNNTGWSITGCITVGGNAYSDEAGTVWNAANGGLCDGVTPNISLSVDGGAKQSTSCNSSTGAWNFTGSVAASAADKVIVVYFDTNSTNQGTLVTRNNDTFTNIMNQAVTRDHYRVSSQSASGISNNDIDMWDYDQDTDVALRVTAGALVEQAATEVFINAGKSFTPGADVTVSSLDLDGSSVFDQGSATLTLTGSGTGACGGGPGSQRPLCRNTTGTFTAGTGVTVFTGTANTAIEGRVTYAGLTLAPAGGSTPTYTLCANIDGDQSITTNWVIGDATNGVIVDDSGCGSYNLQFIDTLTVNANATLSGNATNQISAREFVGGGTINLSAGTLAQTVNGVGRTFGTTSGSNNWTFNNLILTTTSGNGSPRTITTSGGGSGSIIVNGALSIGGLGGGSTITVDNETNDRAFDVNGSFEITSSGTFQSSSTAAFTVASNFTNNGTFTKGTGTVTLDSTTTATVSGFTTTGTNSFNNLTVATAGKEVDFTAGATQYVDGALTVTGASCTSKVALHSTSSGSAYTLATGSATVTYASIKDSTASPARTATRSISEGGNSGWTIKGCLSLSGTAYNDLTGTTAWASCDGVSQNLKLVVDGTLPVTTACTAGTGAFTFAQSVDVSAANQVITVYMDGVVGSVGASVHRNIDQVTNMNSINVFRNGVRLSTAASAVRNADLDIYDKGQDPDIPFTVTGTTATFDTGTQVRLADVYRPDGDVYVDQIYASAVGASYNGNGANTVYLTSSGTSTTCSNGPGSAQPICITGGAGYTAPANTVYRGTSNTRVAGWTYQVLTLAPDGGSVPTYTLAVSPTAESVVIGDGTNGVDVSTTANNTTLTVNGDLTVNAGGVLSGATTNITTVNGNVTGSGTINLSSNTFEQRLAGNKTFGSTGGSNNWTFGLLSFTNLTGAPVTSTVNSGGTGSIITNSNLSIGSPVDSATTTLDDNTNNRALDVNGAVTISNVNKGILDAPPTASFTVAGSFFNSGTFNANGGTVTFDTATTATLSYATPTTFNNLTISVPSKTVKFDNVNQTNVAGSLTVNGAACGTLTKLESDSAGSQYELNVTGTENVQYARIKDSNAITALDVSTSTSGGNNSGWTIHSGGCTTIALTVTAGTAPNMLPTPVGPGTDASSQSTLNVQTNSGTGYALTAKDTSDTVGMSRSGGGGTIDDWTGTDGAPSGWSAGTNGSNGYFGLSVASATGGRLAKWNTAGCPASCTETAWADNLYFGLLSSDRTLHATTSGIDTTNDDIVVLYRLDPDSSNYAGTYLTTITYTATGNP